MLCDNIRKMLEKYQIVPIVLIEQKGEVTMILKNRDAEVLYRILP